MGKIVVILLALCVSLMLGACTDWENSGNSGAGEDTGMAAAAVQQGDSGDREPEVRQEGSGDREPAVQQEGSGDREPAVQQEDSDDTWPGQELPCETLAKSLTAIRNNNGNSPYLPEWARVMVQKELAGCLEEADSGEYTYRLKSVVISNTETWFSMMIQGSRTAADTAEQEDVLFFVNLDMGERCFPELKELVAEEAVREALAEGACTLTDVGVLPGEEAYAELADRLIKEDHYYDYYVKSDSTVGILLHATEPGDAPMILELDGEWLTAWNRKEEEEGARERLPGLFASEICSADGREYAVITGVKEEYREDFWERWMKLAKKAGMSASMLVIPEEMDGVPVEEIGADAFYGIRMEYGALELPGSIRTIGERAFYHTGISRVYCPRPRDSFFSGSTFPEALERIGDSAFEGCWPVKPDSGDVDRKEMMEFYRESTIEIGARAFADSPCLGAVYVPAADSVIGRDAFAGCGEPFYLCYGENVEGRENLVRDWAEQSGLTAVECPAAGRKVNYPETPMTLTPEVRNFFYGENGEGDQFDSFERSEDAPDYGFEEWHAPCGEFCAGECKISLEASSELASEDGRYSPENLLTWKGRSLAWAEGVEGPGIGESITYRNYNQWHTNSWQNYLRCWEQNDFTVDGYMRYTEICIVNGYAKDQKTWEENGRVRRLLMYVEDKPYAYLELEDTILPQYFRLPPEDIMTGDGEEITFRFVIEDVYPGEVYEDTCLTGLVMEFTGRHGH